ncbi:MAG: serine hydrolase domain-containing protein [Candidatus Thorarchaeota archaeon]
MKKGHRELTGLAMILLMVILASITFPSAHCLVLEGTEIRTVERDYWPTDEWRKASPLDHGVNETRLQAMMDYIEEGDHDIHAAIVVRHGYVIWEEYPGDRYNPSRLHTIQSCTKSFTSTLIGIAIQQGFIDNVSQKMIDFFPERTIENLDSRKANLTLHHMLTMSDGLHWTEHDYPYTDERNTHYQMEESNDPIQYLLDLPMAREPGEEFRYNSGMSILLGEIVEQVTGQHLVSFADEYLFDPIGIDRFNWYPMMTSGVIHTAGGLFLSARSMARLGYLMLNNGTWNDTEVVSNEWVEEATRTQVETPWNYGYGYQWWTLPDYGVYAATGRYEQKIYVAPEDDLVVVFTANIADDDPRPTDYLLATYILPAVVTEPLALDENGIDFVIPVLLVVPLIIAVVYWTSKRSELS